MKRITLLLGIFLIGAILLACSPKVTPLEKPIAPVLLTPETQIKEGWEEKWEKILKYSRKEGIVTVYTFAGPQLRAGLAPTFYERYGIRMEFVLGKGAELARKITTERQAGIYTPDLFIGGSTTMITQLKPQGFLDPLEPVLLLPEVINPDLWLDKRLRFIDKDHTILAFTSFPSAPLGRNTNLMKPGDIKSYMDLLSPKWKGKLLMNDTTVAGTGAKWFGITSTRIMSLDYMRQLAKQEPTIIRDLRIQLEWLAQGKYPLLFVPHSPTMREFQGAGAPVAEFTPVEGTYVTAGSGNVVLVNQAPHPNAARVLLNWLLTREAGLLWQKAMGQQSARMDVPPDFLEPGTFRQAGVIYVDADDEEFLLKQPEHMETAREIFGHLMR